MNPMLIFLIVATIIITFTAVFIFGWQIVEKNTFSEFFVGQVIGVEKGKIPGTTQYIFTYKKRGKPSIISSRPLWHSKRLKNGGLYRIQVFHRRMKGKEFVAWAMPVLGEAKGNSHA